MIALLLLSALAVGGPANVAGAPAVASVEAPQSLPPTPPLAPQRAQILLSTMGDDIAFDHTAIEAEQARPLEITFTNKASAESAITHDVVVLLPGTQDAIFEALRAVDYDLQKLKGDPRILALGAELQPGRTQVLTVQFPAPGVYPFVCLMPGHGDMMGMSGTITVR